MVITVVVTAAATANTVVLAVSVVVAAIADTAAAAFNAPYIRQSSTRPLIRERPKRLVSSLLTSTSLNNASRSKAFKKRGKKF